jgi:hypothetical protein
MLEKNIKTGRLMKEVRAQPSANASIRVIKANSVHGVDQCGICKKNEVELINAEPGHGAICDDCRKKIIEGKI